MNAAPILRYSRVIVRPNDQSTTATAAHRLVRRADWLGRGDRFPAGGYPSGEDDGDLRVSCSARVQW